MSKSTKLTKLEPDEQETHSAIVKAIFSLIKMIVEFLTDRKKRSNTNV